MTDRLASDYVSGFVGIRRLFEPNAGKPVYPYSGYHAPDSLFLASGPGIRGGRIDGSIRDVMPTVMELLDLPVAADRRGRALPIR